ncbi:MAG TPA: translocation/assembly module TamB domain-containing protein, partial [Polyangiaceae bacterium]|nr:translocation/assembly module TamB domain-containing protein [Polyangiaceae bacterium]
VRGSLKEGRFEASVRAKGKQLGSLDAEVSGWSPMAANARGGSQLRAKLSANDFQLKSLEPLVAGSVSGLEGLMDAELEGELSGNAPTLRGHVAVSHGAAQLPAIGQTLHSIEARVKLDKNRIALNRFDARGLTGRLRARGSAVLDGLALRSAEASVAITERDKIPLTVQGVTLGDAWGRASVRYRPVDERRQRLDVNVARFNLELPDVSPPGVQSLEPAAHIEVGHRTRAGKFVEIPLQPIEREPSGEPNRWIIAVQLGAVEITKGPGIEVGLTGNLRARVGRKTRLTGRIDLTGGKLDVRGKEFKIERGALTFDRSEVEEGVVTATARWDSPSDYTVYAEYSGTVKEGQLTLRSEPPLTQDEVLGLLMFGTPGGTFGARKQDEAATAVGVAGGTVTKGLNRALSEFTALDLSTRVDTSTGESRPELVLQVTPSVTARVTQAIGEPPPGQSPDRTFLTVDLRLFRRWSLSAQVGDEGGSSLDLIWRHRY